MRSAALVHLGMPFDIIEGPVPELPPEYNLFPPLKVYHDCITNPACDPPLAYIGVKWGGGDLGMLFDYASPAVGGDFQVSLLDRQGKVLATAKPIGPPMSSLASLAPEGLAVQGKKSLFAEGLKQDWYFLGVDGPFPTRFTYQLGQRDADQDGVDDFLDNCRARPQPATARPGQRHGGRCLRQLRPTLQPNPSGPRTRWRG